MSFYGSVAIGIVGLMWFLIEFSDRLEEKEILDTGIMRGMKLLVRMLAFSLGLPLLGLLERFADIEYPTSSLNNIFSFLYIGYFWTLIALVIFLFVYYLIIGPLQARELKEATDFQKKKFL